MGDNAAPQGLAMRRFLSILRKPVVLVLPVFLAWVALFCKLAEAQHWPNYEFSMGVKSESRDNGGFTIAGIPHVSNDGKHVIIRVVDHSIWSEETLQTWDTSSRRNVTGTPSDPTPRAFESDDFHLGFFEEGDWLAFQKRWADQRTQALDKWSKKVSLDGCKPQEFLAAGYSKDGRYFYYGVRDGLPVYEFKPPIKDERMRIDAIAVEEVATGNRMALLPGVLRSESSFWLFISPDGKNAVSTSDYWEKAGYDGPVRLLLWDLAGSCRRTELTLHVELGGLNGLNYGTDIDIRYSDDSRLVFIWYKNFETRWWDTATGKLQGNIANSRAWALLDGGPLLVTYQPNVNDKDETIGTDLVFWDTRTALELGRLSYGDGESRTYWDWGLRSAPNGPYFARVLGYGLPQRPPPASKRFWLWNVLFPKSVARDQSHVLLIHGFDQREVAYLPGRTATFSASGHWLATIDFDGVVRVWELPLRRPWLRIFGYAAIATLACAFTFIAIRWSLRRVQA
jgi:WD40 repeat protein